MCLLQQSGVFHEDIYPLTAANQPALTAHQWLMGQNKGETFVCFTFIEIQSKILKIKFSDNCVC